MTDKYQTQCPHCGVKFQITAQQLALANGTVRCGSCLQVFQAGKNMMPMSSAPPPAGVGSARRPAPAVPATAAPAKQPPAQQAPTKAAPPPARPPTRPAAPPAAAPKKPVAPAPAEPQWAAPPPPKKPAASSPSAPTGSKPRHDVEENKLRISIGAGEINKQLLEDDDPFAVSGSSTLAPIINNSAAAADESWARDLMGEGTGSEGDERVRKFQIKADDLSIMDQTGVGKKSALQDRLERMAPAPVSNNDRAATPRRQPGPPDSLDEDELDFLNEPGFTVRDVELPGLGADNGYTNAIHTHEVNWSRNSFWGTLSAVFALALFGQYLVFNFDTLARDGDWRGVYEAACGAVGCELPGNSAVNRIQGANLVIRSHPTATHALILDAVVYNRAPFAQPFPRLEVSFSDPQGKPVAGRIFSPAEYLSGELSANDLMPSNTPIHLTLELVDPDIAAMNYEVRFLPPDAS